MKGFRKQPLAGRWPETSQDLENGSQRSEECLCLPANRRDVKSPTKQRPKSLWRNTGIGLSCNGSPQKTEIDGTPEQPHKSLINRQPTPLINAQLLTLDEQFIKHTWSSKMTSPANPALAACKAFLANLQSVHYCQGNMDLQLYGNVLNIQNWTLSHYIIKNGVYPITWKLVFLPLHKNWTRLHKKTDTCSHLSEQRRTISSLNENSVKLT